MVGRPRVYHYDRTRILIELANSTLDFLDQEAFSKGISMTELIQTILSKSDIEENAKLSEELRILRKQVDKFSRDNEKTLFYEELQPDELVIKAFNTKKET